MLSSTADEAAAGTNSRIRSEGQPVWQPASAHEAHILMASARGMSCQDSSQMAGRSPVCGAPGRCDGALCLSSAAAAICETIVRGSAAQCVSVCAEPPQQNGGCLPPMRGARLPQILSPLLLQQQWRQCCMLGYWRSLVQACKGAERALPDQVAAPLALKSTTLSKP